MTDTSVESGLPNVSHDEHGAVSLEWWRGDRKITMYPMDGMLLKVWGPNCISEMDDVRLEDHAAVRAAFQWLHQAVPASSPAACSPADSSSLDAVDAARYRWMRDVGDATWRPLGIREGCSAALVDAAIDAAISNHSEGR